MRHVLKGPRLGWAWALVCATACATTGQPAVSGRDPELTAQLRAMAQRQAALEAKLERMESRLDAMRVGARAAPAAEASKERPAASLVPENLATVRLAPPSKKAPAVATEVGLREPDEKALEKMLADAQAANLDGEPPPEQSQGEYETALAAITTGDVERGAAGLQAFADKHPRDERAPTALFQAGMGMLNFGDPQLAVLAFERVAQDYPTSREAPEAMVRLAECQTRLKRADRAKDSYAKVVSRYPGTAAAKAAEAGLKNLAAGQAK